MRRSLWALLGVSVSLSVLALVWPKARSVVDPVARMPVGGDGQQGVALMPSSSPVAAHWDAPALEPSRGDPFDLPAPSKSEAPPVAKQAVVATAEPVVPPKPQPVAPPVTWRVMGSMTGPEGQRHLYLAQAETLVVAQPGTELPDGYVVESIATDAVRLLYPSLELHASVPIPPAPVVP